MNLIEVFHEQMDQLFWSGFSQQLMKDEPERYRWELAEFIKMYQ